MSINNITPEEWDAKNGKMGHIVDMVKKPPHYTHGEIECIDYIRQQLGLAFTTTALGKFINTFIGTSSRAKSEPI